MHALACRHFFLAMSAESTLNKHGLAGWHRFFDLPTTWHWILQTKTIVSHPLLCAALPGHSFLPSPPWHYPLPFSPSPLSLISAVSGRSFPFHLSCSRSSRVEATMPHWDCALASSYYDSDDMRLKSKRASLALYVKVRCGLTRKPGFNAISATQLPNEKKQWRSRYVDLRKSLKSLGLYCQVGFVLQPFVYSCHPVHKCHS